MKRLLLRRRPESGRRLAARIFLLAGSRSSGLLSQREVLQAHGWSVVQVWDQRTTGEDPQKWVGNRPAAALDFIQGDPQKLVLAKSVTSLAASTVAAMGVPAIWLTPLLRRREVQAGVAAAAVPALLVGGSADELWDGESATRLATDALVEVVEIAGADHGLQFPGDPARSVAALGTVVGAIDGFVDRPDIQARRAGPSGVVTDGENLSQRPSRMRRCLHASSAGSYLSARPYGQLRSLTGPLEGPSGRQLSNPRI